MGRLSQAGRLDARRRNSVHIGRPVTTDAILMSGLDPSSLPHEAGKLVQQASIAVVSLRDIVIAGYSTRRTQAGVALARGVRARAC